MHRLLFLLLNCITFITKIADGLTVILEPENVLQAAKTEVFVNCITKPVEDVHISWEKDYKPIPSYFEGIEEEIYVLPNNTLYLKSLKKKEAGTYTCSAFLMMERQVKSVVIEVAYLQRINTIDPIEVLQGYPAEIACVEPPGKPQPRVKWLFNGKIILSDNPNIDSSSWTLKIKQAMRSDAGNYTCVAFNSVTDRTAETQLTVVVAGDVEVSPLNDTIKEGDSTSFKCESKADPPLAIKWKRAIDVCLTTDGSKPVCKITKEDIIPGDRINISGGTLTIKNASVDDEGNYLCQTELSTQISSAKVQLNILELMKVDKKTHLETQIRDTLNHENTKITCHFRGDGKYSVQWTRLSPTKDLHSNMKVVNDSIYISNLKFEDEGRFKCVAVGEHNSATAYVNLVVFESPQFSISPKNVTAYIGEPVWVQCQGIGFPKPRVHYLRDSKEGGNLNETHFVKLPNDTLFIKSLKKEDSGQYLCWLTEQYKSIYDTFTITVLEKNTSTSKGSPMGRTVGIAVGCAGVYILLVIGLMIYCRARRARLLKKGMLLEVDGEARAEDPLLGANDIPLVSVEKFNLDRENIKEVLTLGHGKFGKVFKGLAKGICEEGIDALVAVKVFDEKPVADTQSEFNKEVGELMKFKNDFVIRLLGFVREYPFYIVLDYSEQGNLKEYLQSNKTILTPVCFRMCHCIAKGMEYLASLPYIHRDLAARNCIVFSQSSVKVSFLSLCKSTYKDDYYLLNDTAVPLRWLAPEVVKERNYNEKSDVWSFSVTMWEVFSRGIQPFCGISNEEIVDRIGKDLQLTIPSDCPKSVYKIMLQCWLVNNFERPTFSELLSLMAEINPQE